MRSRILHIKNIILTSVSYTAAMGLAFILTGCFTGIEGTKKIEVSRHDRQLIAPLPEDLVLDQVHPIPLSDWPANYLFTVSDAKVNILLDHSPDAPPLNPGDPLYFSAVDSISLPDGRDYARIIFRSSDGQSYFYNTGKSVQAAFKTVESDKIPLVLDVKMIEMTDSILRGYKVWNKSAIAYLPSDERISVLKYSPLIIDSVSYGKGHFPLQLWVTPDIEAETNVPSLANIAPFFVYMDFNSSIAESRPFRKLFSLSDPKTAYPNVSDQTWLNIRKGVVAAGMTKDECRLSLGNPSDVNSGHDYNSTIDIWQYPDGTFLRFVDGVLISFRK